MNLNISTVFDGNTNPTNPNVASAALAHNFGPAGQSLTLGLTMGGPQAPQA